MFGSTRELIIVVTVIVLAGILGGVAGLYVSNHRPHMQRGYSGYSALQSMQQNALDR